MNGTNQARNLFALLCLLALIAVATGALLEIARARRGQSVVTVNQFRLRMLSALVWMLVLGSLSYATLFLWPARGDGIGARRFLAVVSGAFLLIIIGLLLLLYDVWQVGAQRRREEARFQRQFDEAARQEIERVETQRAQSTLSPPEAPHDSSHETDEARP